jgi:hypothetical protein
VLEFVIGRANLQRAGAGQAIGELLADVNHFMREEFKTCVRIGIVAAVAEENIRSAGASDGAESTVDIVCLGPDMKADCSEVLPQDPPEFEGNGITKRRVH